MFRRLIQLFLHFGRALPVPSVFKRKLPCETEGVLGEDGILPCTRVHASGERSTCPVSVKLRGSIENIQNQSQRCGYAYVGWVVLKGPKCDLVCFQREPDASAREELYGDRLITIVPV